MRCPTLFLLFKIVLAIQDLLRFCMNLRKEFSVSTKTVTEILIVFALNMWVILDGVDILKIYLFI